MVKGHLTGCGIDGYSIAFALFDNNKDFFCSSVFWIDLSRKEIRF